MKQLVNNLDLDICAITETWLREGDEVGKVAQKPDGYEIHSSPCPSRLGGGIATIHKENLRVAKSHEYQSPVNVWILKSVLISVHIHLGWFYRPEDHPFLFIHGRVHEE